MSFPISPGIYGREIDRSAIVGSVANSIGAIVISSDKGPTGTVTLVTSNKEFIDIFGTPVPTKLGKYAALNFLEFGNRLYVARAINDAVASTLSVNDDQGVPVLAFTVNAHNEGAWGENLTISTSAEDASDVFLLTVKESGIVVETWTVTRNPLQKDGYGKSQYIEDVINGQSAYITVVDNTANPYTAGDVEVISDSSLAGGSDDTVAPTDAQINTEWDRFAVKEDIEISLMINGGTNANAVVHTKMITIAESRKDCFAILDFDSTDDTVAEMVTYAGTTLNANTSYAAIYANWLQIYDQYNDKTLYVPPSGYIAGVFAKTAQVSEVWYAPAGEKRGILNVLGVKTIFSEGDRDTLYTAKINPIQNFPGSGIQVYGQKTLQTAASATDRVNVRMLMITIEKALAKALRPFVFEFNDTFTRENISSIINNYMEDIKTRRGVYDYLTVCNTSNNTAQVIDQNKMIVDVYVKPTRVAEFIQLNAIISATGAKFTAS